MKIIKLSLLFALISSAYAGVSTKNGDFWLVYTDLVVPGAGKSLEIKRTYNSQATNKGWFGFGWGSLYETFLEIAVDGSVIVHEEGAGALTRFTPQAAVNAKAAAERVVDAMNKENSSKGKGTLNENEYKKMVTKLTNDAEARQAEARRLNVTTKLAKGTVLYSSKRGHQTIVVIDDGYKRVASDGREDYFSKEGQLISIKEKDGYTVNFQYEKGQLVSIKDSFAKQIFFEWYPNKRIKSLWSAGDKKAQYEFKEDDLVKSTDVGGNKYAYTYDNTHNLIRVDYSDKTSLLIGYDPKTKYVTSIKDRNGESVKYGYGADPKDPARHYWTTVTRKSFGNKEVTDKYEYIIKNKTDGELYVDTTITTINNVKTETKFTACCNLPSRIARGNLVTNFEYNKDGLLTKKSSTTGEFVNITYNEKVGKIAKVVNNDGWTSFEYDAKGNLYKALNNKNQAVLLVYNKEGKIATMVDQDNSSGGKKRALNFKYNALGKPIKISLEGAGELSFSYDNYGAVQKVDSSQSGNPNMTGQVTKAFQNLLAIVKPAGVDLSI